MLGKKNDSQDEPSHDRYLVTYADLITLLLGLFVILYASSQVDSSKYKEFQAAFSAVFKSKNSGNGILEGGDGVLQGSRKGIPESIVQPTQHESIIQISKKTQSALRNYINQGLVEVSTTKDMFVISLPEKLLFASGKADINSNGSVALDTIASVIRSLENPITVDGHTDNQAIKTFQFESNWHLSLTRAMNIAYYLMQKGVSEKSMAIRGFGDTRPKVENTNKLNRAKNRRVEITVSEIPLDIPSVLGYTKNDSLLKK